MTTSANGSTFHAWTVAGAAAAASRASGQFTLVSVSDQRDLSITVRILPRRWSAAAHASRPTVAIGARRWTVQRID